jgi:hypothetical protein
LLRRNIAKQRRDLAMACLNSRYTLWPVIIGALALVLVVWLF